MRFYEHLFSVKNKDTYWLVRFLGIKFKINIRREIKYSELWKEKEGDVSHRFKIAFYVACPDNRSERYRVDNIIDALSRRGYIADKYYSNNINILKYRLEYHMLVIFRSGDLDGDIYEKVVETIKQFKALGKTVIYDVDDFVLQKERYREKSVSNAKSIIQLCDAVTTTTDYLANLLRSVNESVFLIRNTINYKQYAEAMRLQDIPKENPNIIKIVYQSGTDKHDNDFLECTDALLDILERYPHVQIHLIGPLKVDRRFDRYRGRVLKVNYMDYIDLLRYVSNMDINIAPLKINLFNNSKSELKIFESALLKIPSVVSGTVSYINAIKNGHNGFIANNRDEWIDCLSKLIEDSSFRKTMAENAYHEIVPLFYIDNEIERIIPLYQSWMGEGKSEKR